MSQPEYVESADTVEMLRRISLGIGIILWIVLTQLFTWPVAAAISGYSNTALLDSGNLVPGAIIAAVVAFVCVRLVFPITYPVAKPSTEAR